MTTTADLFDEDVEPSEQHEFEQMLQQGSDALQQGHADQAKGLLERALRFKPRNQRGRNMLGLSLFKLGMLDKAEAIYRSLIEDHPADPTLRVNLGLVFLKSASPSDAVRCFETALDLAPAHAKAQNYLGLALAQKGELAQAREWFVTCGNTAMAEKMTQALAASPLRAVAESAEQSLEGARPFTSALDGAPGASAAESAGWIASPPAQAPAPPVRVDDAAAPPEQPSDEVELIVSEVPVEAPLELSYPPPPASRPPLAAEPNPEPGALSLAAPEVADGSLAFSDRKRPSTGEHAGVREARRGRPDAPPPVHPVAVEVAPPAVRPPPPPPEALEEASTTTPALYPALAATDAAPRGSPFAAGNTDLFAAPQPPAAERAGAVQQFQQVAPRAGGPDRELAPERPRGSSGDGAAPAASQPPAALAAYTDSKRLEVPTGEGFVIGQTEILVRVRGEVLTRLDGLVASWGQLTVRPELKRFRGKATDKPFGEGARRMLRATGEGRFVISREQRHFTPLELGDEPAYFREEILFAFEESLVFENGRVPSKTGGDLHLVHLRGRGRLLLVTAGVPRSVEVRKEPLRVPMDQLIGWHGPLIQPRLVPICEEAPELGVALELAGEGRALVDAPEESR